MAVQYAHRVYLSYISPYDPHKTSCFFLPKQHWACFLRGWNWIDVMYSLCVYSAYEEDKLVKPGSLYKDIFRISWCIGWECSSTHNFLWTLRWLITGLSPQWAEFNPCPIHERSVVDKVAIRHPCQYHSTNAPYSSSSQYYSYQKDNWVNTWNSKQSNSFKNIGEHWTEYHFLLYFCSFQDETSLPTETWVMFCAVYCCHLLIRFVNIINELIFSEASNCHYAIITICWGL
jgi:hypothetical protein